MATLEPTTDVTTPPSLIELRRDLHRHPELRFDLPRTSAIVAERVRAAGWQVQTGIAGSGILATLVSGEPGSHVMLRADMDALAVTDTKGVAYASSNPGVTHACGHDVHTTVMVGVAERFAAAPPARGRVSIVFQPAEEMPYGAPSGAMTMLEEGLFADGAPDVALALHCWPDLPGGSIGIDERIAMAGKDAFSIAVRGKPAHAATPSRGRDAILALSQVVLGLYQGYARGLDPGDLAALNVGTIRGGSSQSIVAAEAEATGTIRSVDEAVRARLRDTAERVVAGAARGVDVEAELTWSDIVPPVVNDPRLVRCAWEVGRDALGEASTHRLAVPPMTADDFAFLAELAPALYLKLGVGRGEASPPLHSGAFDVDERCIGVGVAVMHGIAERLLARPIETWAG